MKIIFDLDGTIINSQKEMIKQANKKLAKKISIKDWKTYNPKKCFSSVEYDAITSSWNLPVIYQRCKPFASAIDAISQIKLGNYIEICTFSGYDNFEELSAAKFNILKKYNIPYDEFVSTPDFKVNLCGDVLIEDSVDNLLNNNIKHKLLFTRPWNKNFDSEKYGIIRFTHFSEIPKIISKLR